VQASARSIGPRRDKWIVLNILATASIAPDETDRADVARSWHGSIELTSAIAVAMQTGTASACGVCVRPCEQGRKKERSDNKPKFRHKHLRAVVVRDKLMLNTTAARIDLRQWLLKAPLSVAFIGITLDGPV
jgi:hypothetical protein